MAITFGIHIGPQNISIDDLRRLWNYADTHGFRWISVWDHFYEAPPVDGNSPHFEAVALMSAIACETRNVEIGCLVFCMNNTQSSSGSNPYVALTWSIRAKSYLYSWQKYMSQGG